MAISTPGQPIRNKAPRLARTTRRTRAAVALSAVVVVGGAVSAAIGLLVPGFYPDPPVVGATSRGNDLALLLIGGSMAVMWGFYTLRFAVTGQAPSDVLPLPLDRVHLAYALDLGLLTPPLIMAGVLLWSRRPWGCVLSVVMLVAVAVFQLNYVAMRILVADVADIGPVDPFEYAFVAGLAAVVGWLLLAIRGRRDG